MKLTWRVMELRINGRIKWNEAANSNILECKRQAQLLVNSENPPWFEKERLYADHEGVMGTEGLWLSESLGAELKRGLLLRPISQRCC